MDEVNEDDCKNAYKCSDCDRMFSRKVQYEKHIRQHVHVPDPVPVPDLSDIIGIDCEVCGKTFKNEKSLKIHTQRHNTKNKIACVICGKKFCQRSSLKLHLRVHNNQRNPLKKYECEMCDKYFPSENDLKKHRSACHDEKPFSCNICNERFSWRDQVSSHYCAPKHEVKSESEDTQNTSSVMTRNIDVYQVTDDKSITCGICQRQFSQKGHLILHYRRTHNRELLIERLL